MNVQQTIIKGIKEQLFFYDYLVLPGFGGFVLKLSPSQLSASGTLIVPPSKTVGFNAQLKQNDSILAIWLQNTLLCTADEALAHLLDFAAFCNSILTARRRLTMEGIGFFYLDFENNLCFEPQKDTNFLSGSFGLGPVSIRQIEAAAPELKKETVFVDRSLVDEKTVRQPRTRSKNYQRLTVPIIALCLLFGLLVVFVSNNKFSGQLRASLSGNDGRGIYTPLNYPDLGISTPDYENTPYVVDANGIAVIALAKDKNIAVKVLETPKIPALTNHLETRKVRAAHHYEIVLGCFSVLDNAKRMVSTLSRQNVEAFVSGKNEKALYTVSNGSFKTREEALARLNEIKQNFPKAWIKKP